MPSDHVNGASGERGDDRRQASPLDRGTREDELEIAGAAEPEPPKRRPADREPPRAKPRHDRETAALAREQGFTAAEIDSFSPEQLDFLTDQIERRAEHRARAAQSALDRSRAPAPPPPPAAPAEDDSPWGEAEVDDGTGKKVRRKLTDDDYDPAIAGPIRKLWALVKDVPGLKEKLGLLEQGEARRVARTYDDVIDDAFEGLGTGYLPIFGEGSIDELAADARERELRTTVVAAAIKAGLDLKSQPSPRKVKKAIQAAAGRLFGHLAGGGKAAEPAAGKPPAAGAYGTDTAAAPPPDRTPPQDPETGRFLPRAARDGADDDEAELADRYRRGGVETPTHRQARERKGREAALAAVRDFKAENGIAVHSGPAEEFEP